MKEVAEKIRFWRTKKGFSQEIMSKKLDISLNAYSKIERGITDVNISRLEQIAKSLDISLGQLVAPEENGKVYVNGDGSTGLYQNGYVIIGVNEGNKELLIELQRLKTENEAQLKEIAYLKEIIGLLREKTDK